MAEIRLWHGDDFHISYKEGLFNNRHENLVPSGGRSEAGSRQPRSSPRAAMMAAAMAVADAVRGKGASVAEGRGGREGGGRRGGSGRALARPDGTAAALAPIHAFATLCAGTTPNKRTNPR